MPAWTLRQGAFCTDATGCVPSGGDAGSDARSATRPGTLVATDDGSWAVVVDRGRRRAGSPVGTGLDEAAFRQIAADLVIVDG